MDPSDLASSAYDLCIEVRDGLWDEALKRVRNGQPAACPEVIEALQTRCPGHPRGDYERAIASGMQNSR